MQGRGEKTGWVKRWNSRLALSPLRPWQAVDFTRLLLAAIYTTGSFAFSSDRSWADNAEHILVLLMLALAVTAAVESSRSWVVAMRIRKPVIIIDALLFSALLIVTDPPNSPYFPGIFFIVIEVALIIGRRFHLLLALGAVAAALAFNWVDEVAALPPEPDGERTALRICFLLVTILTTGMLLGPRRETLLERERMRRLVEGDLPASASEPGEFLLQALEAATGAEPRAVLFRTAAQEPLRFAGGGGGAGPAAHKALAAAGTGWHDRRRDASITLSPQGVFMLGRLSPAGEAWADMLGADSVLTIGVRRGGFEAVGGAHLDDPCQEDRAAIAQRVFESACEELMMRHSLDLAHVIAGARERERLQRELHDSVLQALASIRYQLAPVLGHRDMPHRAAIEGVDRIAKDQIATLRYIIHPENDEEDFAYLPETLAMVVRSLGEQWGVRCELEVRDGNCATSAIIGRELSFAVREIVSNAVRHARASAIDFVLEPDGNRIALQVSDNGVPNMARLGSSEAVPSRSLMRRIQMLGGELFLRSIGGVTTIRITIPRK
ncbi:sensor histidine kinase [Sphingobium bisphenolivorans]|uniref:sensor histidine kinase n=1 Tax=Sphingobium bisphenolivorans TaxID=1335760 RepID=UPI0003A6C078|nr:histidine kinase [Sphingobium bisphenolivorans]